VLDDLRRQSRSKDGLLQALSAIETEAPRERKRIYGATIKDALTALCPILFQVGGMRYRLNSRIAPPGIENLFRSFGCNPTDVKVGSNLWATEDHESPYVCAFNAVDDCLMDPELFEGIDRTEEGANDAVAPQGRPLAGARTEASRPAGQVAFLPHGIADGAEHAVAVLSVSAQTFSGDVTISCAYLLPRQSPRLTSAHPVPLAAIAPRARNVERLDTPKQISRVITSRDTYGSQKSSSTSVEDATSTVPVANSNMTKS
jgi:hypothetical protein